MFFPTEAQTQIIRLGRIVPPPPSGSSAVPTQVQPAIFVADAGRAGLATNNIRQATQPAIVRNNETNTGSPNPQTAVGSAGTAGLEGASAAPQPVAVKSAITAPLGIKPTVGPARTPRWVKSVLYIATGVAVGAVLFR